MFSMAQRTSEERCAPRDLNTGFRGIDDWNEGQRATRVFLE